MISLARNILLVPLYLQKIPLAEYGAWLATGGALALMLINDYGLSGVVTQRMSASFGAKDFDALGRLTGSALAIGSLLSIGLVCISLLMVPFLPGLRSLSALQSHTVTMCFMLAVAANGLGVIGATAASTMRSLQRVVLSGSINLAAEIANVGMIVFGLWMGLGLYALAAGLLLRSAIITVAGLVGVWTVCSRSFKIKIAVQPAAVRDLIGESSRFFLSAIAMRLQSQANVFFIGWIVGPASAAIYSLTVRAYETVLMVINLINGSLVPSVTHLLGSGDIPRFRAVVLRLVEFLAALTALAMTMTVILNPAFLSLWVGNAAFGGQGLSVLMAAALFVTSIGGVAYDALIAQGRFRLVTRFYLVTSVSQVLLLVSLLHLGLSMAPLVTLVTAGIWGFGFWRRVAADISLTWDEVRGMLGELMRIVAVSVLGAIAFATFYPTAKSWPALAGEAFLCGLCLAVSYLAISPKLRRITLEEIGATYRVFRAG